MASEVISDPQVPDAAIRRQSRSAGRMRHAPSEVSRQDRAHDEDPQDPADPRSRGRRCPAGIVMDTRTDRLEPRRLTDMPGFMFDELGAASRLRLMWKLDVTGPGVRGERVDPDEPRRRGWSSRLRGPGRDRAKSGQSRGDDGAGDHAQLPRKNGGQGEN